MQINNVPLIQNNNKELQEISDQLINRRSSWYTHAVTGASCEPNYMFSYTR